MPDVVAASDNIHDGGSADGHGIVLVFILPESAVNNVAAASQTVGGQRYPELYSLSSLLRRRSPPLVLLLIPPDSFLALALIICGCVTAVYRVHLPQPVQSINDPRKD